MLVGMQTGVATVEKSMEIPQKIKNGSAFWPSDPTSWTMSEGTQNTNLKECKHPYVHCSVIYISQDMEASQVFVSRWVDETTMEHLYNGIVHSHKKQESLTLCDSMDGPGGHYAKWNKPGRERQIPYDLTHKWNLINNTHKQAKCKQRHWNKEQTDSNQRGGVTGGRRGRFIKERIQSTHGQSKGGLEWRVGGGD